MAEKKKKAERVSVGVTASPDFLPELEGIVKQMVKPGMKVAVEYTEELMKIPSAFPQDDFWKGVVKLVRNAGGIPVFVDSTKLRKKLYDWYSKGKTLDLIRAKIMISEREKVFVKKGIAKCPLDFLGAAHSINLKNKTNSKVLLTPFASALHFLKLIPLTPNQLIDPKFVAKRNNILSKLNPHKTLTQIVSESKKKKQKTSRKVTPKRRL
ncbi:MAG: hypothetical protein COT90_01260 [Candidatus Diapherotrites archaeon CG10_big_fil_rev_8_21_14_0_10_31_34]|nr:MAG: hypothetical protein COT90_01260 [Candidatus Diapherotrites archaeon CG10_big_fil_rev_8_21_14_0_10_31_34]